LTKRIPRIYATRFFQLVTSRQFAEAERILERVKQKMHVNERNRGYFQALYGMLLTKKSNNDRYAFLSLVEVTDKKHLRNYQKEFLSHAESRFHADYDRGFFEAWADYMKVLQKIEMPVSPTTNKGAVEKGVELETVTETKKEEPDKGKLENTQVEPHQSKLFEFGK
jgi:uncharacterized SAM-dependent methyltransferase